MYSFKSHLVTFIMFTHNEDSIKISQLQNLNIIAAWIDFYLYLRTENI